MSARQADDGITIPATPPRAAPERPLSDCEMIGAWIVGGLVCWGLIVLVGIVVQALL